MEKERHPDLEATQEEDFPGSGGAPGANQPAQAEGEREYVDDQDASS